MTTANAATAHEEIAAHTPTTPGELGSEALTEAQLDRVTAAALKSGYNISNFCLEL